jgi:hypothetical protein
VLLRLLGRRSCRRRGSLIPGSLSILVAEPDSDPTCEKSLELTSTTPVYVLAVFLDVWTYCGTERRFALL